MEENKSAYERLVDFCQYMIDTGKISSIGDFEKHCGLSTNYMRSRPEKKELRKGGVGSDIISRVYTRFPQLNIEWLITGKGLMTRSMLDKERYESISRKLKEMEDILNEIDRLRNDF